MQDGQKNGLCHFSSQHSAIGIVKEEDACYLEYRKNGNITKGIQIHSEFVWFRTEWEWMANPNTTIVWMAIIFCLLVRNTS